MTNVSTEVTCVEFWKKNTNTTLV